MESGVKLRTTTTKDYSVTFSREEFLRLLHGETNPFPYRVPFDAKVTVRVPGGGDYSSQTLGLDEVDGVTVSWTTTEVK